MTAAASTPASRRLTPLRGVCGGAIALCAAWAMWPLGPSAATATPSRPSATEHDSKTTSLVMAPLDLVAFKAPLWVIPPPPPAPPPPPPPPPPLKLQLVAIVTESAGLGKSERAAALLYDPDQDKLLTVHEGETLQGRKVERITDARVHIRDASGERVLSLRADQPGGGGTP